MANTFKEKKKNELKKELTERREELRDIDLGRKAPSHPKRQQELRRDIARIMTEFNSRR